MPRHQSHRGPAPKDEKLFSQRRLPALRAAGNDLCWLLDRGYSSHSAIELVGNRYNLVSRQRMAVSRSVRWKPSSSDVNGGAIEWGEE